MSRYSNTDTYSQAGDWLAGTVAAIPRHSCCWPQARVC